MAEQKLKPRLSESNALCLTAVYMKLLVPHSSHCVLDTLKIAVAPLKV